jgi:hypothetical protein
MKIIVYNDGDLIFDGDSSVLSRITTEMKR